MDINLPQFDINLRRSVDGQLQVYDPLRSKYVALTPEEWVRQHFVNFLTTYRGYPASFMANEVGLRLCGVQRRCDTVVYDQTAHPLAIVEYKASTVALTAKVFDQIVRYNMVLGVRWLMVSNGLKHYCCRVDKNSGTYTFVKEIPTYAALTEPQGQDAE